MKEFKTKFINFLIKNQKQPLENNAESLIEKIDNYCQNQENRIKIVTNSLHQSSKEISEYVTELEEKTLRLTHSNKMSTIGEMSSSLSHEINNPLFVILSNSEIIEFLVKNQEFENKEKVLSALSAISSTVDKIKKITFALKNLSNEKSDFSYQEKNIKEVITEACSFSLESLKNKKINTTFNLFDYNLSLPTVEFSQVLINLITNAKHAVEDLSSSEKYINISMKETDSSIIINFENGGPKIPKEIEDKIFDSFFTTKPVGKGTGLGLSISKKIIEKMGGSLKLNIDSDHPSFSIELKKQ